MIHKHPLPIAYTLPAPNTLLHPAPVSTPLACKGGEGGENGESGESEKNLKTSFQENSRGVRVGSN